MREAKPKAAGTPRGAATRTQNPSRSGASARPSKQRPAGKAVLLSGGNPQIAKADGDAPVQAYIAAMPGWKRALGERLDALVTRTVPGVRKAVRWNSPMYGVEGQGWFLSFHVFTRYVKVTFFEGVALRPVPPGGTEKSQDTRWLDLHEDDALDEVQLAAWVRQAAALPGWDPSAPKKDAAARPKSRAQKAATSKQVTAKARAPGDWRSETLARVRAVIQQAAPTAVEELKWRGVPVWSDGGMICTGETYKNAVKLTFARGAALPDPKGLFNASLEGNTRRAIDLREGAKLDEAALKALVRAAVALNHASARR